MKMVVYRTGTLDIDNPQYIEIESLDELLSFVEKHDHPIIISKPANFSYDKFDKKYIDVLNHWMLEIYDDYRK